LHESATGIAHRRELDSRIGYRNRIHESPCERGLMLTKKDSISMIAKILDASHDHQMTMSQRGCVDERALGKVVQSSTLTV